MPKYNISGLGQRWLRHGIEQYTGRTKRRHDKDIVCELTQPQKYKNTDRPPNKASYNITLIGRWSQYFFAIKDREHGFIP